MQIPGMFAAGRLREQFGLRPAQRNDQLLS
jgi:hypothetical protein